MLYGDVLRYPLDKDPTDSWRFMFITASRYPKLIDTIVLRLPPNDDLWVVGDLIATGIYELEIAPE